MQVWTSDMEKQCADRVQTVLNDPQLLTLFKQFGGPLFRRSSVFHGLARCLEQWSVRGARCVEIGTWNALTAVILSRHFDEVVTIDIARNPMKHDVVALLGIKNIRFIEVEDNGQKADAVKHLGPFDGAYLDGDHAHDTDGDWELVKDSGQVIFHEVWRFQAPVWHLVHSLPREEVRFGGCGLAIWKKGAAGAV